ncbi:MAG: hypothetical protein LLG20_23010 [Acidobacteriales bacterium]|nr:hypothetical protein [Terriglobales bacterium]
MQRLARLGVTFGVLLLPCIWAAQAPDYAVSGPSLGLVAGRTAGTIRPILGIPGAAMWGAPLVVDFATTRTAVAPGGDFAVMVASENFRLARVRATGGAPEWLPVEAAGSAPDIVSFSPRGRSAVLYYRAAGRMVVLSGLRDQTVQATEVDTSSLPAATKLLAVSEDGSSLLAAIQEGEATAVYFLKTAPAETRSRLSATVLDGIEGEPEPLPTGTSASRLTLFGAVTALEFAGDSQDALVADASANSIFLMADVGGSAQTVLLGSAREGIADPSWIKAPDNKRVLVANAGTGAITVLYRDGTSPLSIQCGCTITGLNPLGGGAVYRLTEPSSEPLLLLDAGGLEPRLVVVPPEPSQPETAPAEQGGDR